MNLAKKARFFLLYKALCIKILHNPIAFQTFKFKFNSNKK